jgi:hypothetical protein
VKIKTPLALSVLFSASLALSVSAAPPFDPSVAPEGSTVYVEVKNSSDGTSLRAVGRKCPTGYVPVPTNGKLVCKPQNEHSDRVQQMMIEAQMAGPSDATRMQMMGGVSPQTQLAGQNYIYGQDRLSPFVMTTTCPAGTTAKVTKETGCV